MRSSQSSSIAACALALSLAASASLSAHRKDEYLQAARIAIEPHTVQVELDLTPGIAVAEAVLADIDVDGNARISTGESQLYASRVRDSIRLDVDSIPLEVRLIGSTYPDIAQIRNGEGTIRLRLEAPLPGLRPGAHRLHYGNRHRSDIGVYLANTLVPANIRVAVTGQERDVDQRSLDVAYVLRDESAGARRSPVLYLAGALTAVIALRLARRSSSSESQSARQRNTSR